MQIDDVSRDAARALGDGPMAPGEAPLSSGRRVAIRIVGVLGLLAFNFMLAFVLTDVAGRGNENAALEQPGSVEARIGAEHPHESVHLVAAAAALIMGVGGLAGLVVRPPRAGSATHVGLAAVGWLLVSGVVGDPDNYGGQAGPLDLAFIVLAAPALMTALLAAPWRAWRGRLARPELLWVAALGTPWLWYGIQQALMQRYTWPPLADPHHQAHWFVTSLVAVLIVLLTAGGSLPGAGWRVATATSGVAALGIGVASLVDVQAASALHPAWAAGAILWGLLVLTFTWRAVRLEFASDDV